MAANSRWKYIYSAADDKEWLFKIGEEDRNLANDPSLAVVRETLKQNCIDRFRKDGYTSAIDGNDWKRFDPPTVLQESDEGLLFQEPPELQGTIEQLGPYSRQGVDQSQSKYQLISNLADLSLKTD